MVYLPPTDLQHRDIQFDLPEGLGQVNMKFKGGKKDIKISQVNVELASSCGNGAKAKAQTNSEEIASKLPVSQANMQKCKYLVVMR